MTLIVKSRDALWRLESGKSRRIRSNDDRRSETLVLFRVAKHLNIDLADSLSELIEDGFGNRGEGDDRFDAVIGLFGKFNVLRGNRAPGDPRADARHLIEGWILGQVNPCG